jgi:uncharacterized protein (DUF488 family)
MSDSAASDRSDNARQASGDCARFVTIGHSNRASQSVIDMLREANVGLVVDVRAFPRSRTNPAFNIESFPAELATQQIGYRHFPAFGGRRSRHPEVDEALNAFWRVQSFHNFADYALGDEFHAALCDLQQLGTVQRVALMCSEALWWRCHRRIIADYLLAAGHDLIHLMAPGKIQKAALSKGAKVRADGRVVYPAADDAPDAAAAPGAPLCHYEELAYRENEARAKQGGTRE